MMQVYGLSSVWRQQHLYEEPQDSDTSAGGKRTSPHEDVRPHKQTVNKSLKCDRPLNNYLINKKNQLDACHNMILLLINVYLSNYSIFNAGKNKEFSAHSSIHSSTYLRYSC